ncbi:hypothetical protein [Streptomyces virginiae]|nr:hypothetical protein [Streptomyces virginiae]MCX5174020.1 hypothetical protein [Streptomyces virginiae]
MNHPRQSHGFSRPKVVIALIGAAISGAARAVTTWLLARFLD